MTIPTADEKNWAIAAHLGPVLVSFLSGGLLQFLVPLVILLVKREDSDFIGHHARQSLNFQLTLFVFAMVYWAVLVLMMLSVIGIPAGIVMACVAPALFFLWQVGLAILAAMKTNEGERFVYPATIPFLAT